MTVSNLGVCFGPTLLRPEEETVASIMDLKFYNVVVEILITHYDKIFNSEPEKIADKVGMLEKPSAQTSGFNSVNNSINLEHVSPVEFINNGGYNVPERQDIYGTNIRSYNSNHMHSPVRPGQYTCVSKIFC